MNMCTRSNGKPLEKLLLYIFMSCGVMFLCMSLNAEVIQEFQSEDSICLHRHYQKLCDAIINVWTVLDIMRSINIESTNRADFVYKLFDDVIMAMREVVILDIGCQMYREYGVRHSDELHYFFEMIDHVENAFTAVFTPAIFGEERLLGLFMIELFESVKNIKQVLTQH